MDFTKYKKDINKILEKSDLDTISAKKVRKQLERDNNVDLSDNKKELDEYITMLFHEFVAKSEKKKTPKKESTKKTSDKKRSTKKRSSKKARSSKKRSTKKRSTKKRTSTKKRSSKKASTTKKRSTKKR
ncbi:MAG TPA: hypothetical protein DD806_00555, partial [Flavobacterium sp.]|nr:hypothetical protein [Flavobacterium sp.]